MIGLQRLTITQRVWIIILLAAFGISAIAVIDLFEYRSTLMQEKLVQTEKLVDTAGRVERFYRKYGRDIKVGEKKNKS